MKRIILILLFSITEHLAFAQHVKVSFEESNEDFVNPERGFYIPTGTKASNYVMLDSIQLLNYRRIPQSLTGASYQVQVSLIYRGYELDIYKHVALPDSFLLKLQKDFDAVRAAGLKLILRFAYTNTSKGGDCKDEYKICPPYGDAPSHIVMQHIRQLKPLFHKNADIIAVMQQGFIGIWGENYFTDHFGDASTNGLGIIADSSWIHRNELLYALLEALPINRMVQVRTPQIKQKAVYGPQATVRSAPLRIAEAYNQSVKSRIGFHNDCLLASADDYGTYYDYGSSKQPRKPANKELRTYIEADTKFTVTGGETCDDAFSPQNDCSPIGNAEAEMRRMHYTYLNAAYNTAVNNDWDSADCLNKIRRHLGYRLVMREVAMPKKAKQKSSVSLGFKIENIGYASPFNPRPCLLVLREIRTGAEYVFTLKTDIRFWFSGRHTIQERIEIGQLPLGQYETFLALPDADERLRHRSEYSIQLANKNVWEAKNGYNKLHHTINIY